MVFGLQITTKGIQLTAHYRMVDELKPKSQVGIGLIEACFLQPYDG